MPKFNMAAFAKDRDTAAIITRLSMGVNDMAKAKYLHTLRDADKSRIGDSAHHKGLCYFSGSYISLLMTSHLVECITTLEAIKSSKVLRELIASDAALKRLAQAAMEYTKNGKQADFINNTTDLGLMSFFIIQRARKYTRGSSRFCPTSPITSAAICRPPTQNL